MNIGILMSRPPSVSALYISAIHAGFMATGDAAPFYSHANDVMQDLKKHICELPYVQGDRYRSLYQLRVDDKAFALIQFDPLLEPNMAFRFQLQPTVAGKEGLAIFHRMLVGITGVDYEKTIANAKVTRLACAVRIDGVCLNDLLLKDEHSRKSAMFFDAYGEVEEIRLGSEASDAFLCATNVGSTALDITERAKTAVELHAALKLRSKAFNQLLTLDNPFADLTITGLPASRSGSSTWRLFLDCCCRRGVTAALSQISNLKLKRRFRKRLAGNLSVGWWDAPTVWGTLPNALGDLGMPCGVGVRKPLPSPAPAEIEDEENDEDW